MHHMIKEAGVPCNDCRRSSSSSSSSSSNSSSSSSSSSRSSFLKALHKFALNFTEAKKNPQFEKIESYS